MTFEPSILQTIGLVGGSIAFSFSGNITPVMAQSMQNVIPPADQSRPFNSGARSMPGNGSTVSFPSNGLPPQTEIFGISSSYRLGIGDEISINTFGAEEYSTEVIVLQDGTINLPRVGQVFVLGMTFQETENAVEASYARFLQQPMVSVSPSSLRPVRVAIAGEVRRPGSYTVQRASEARNDNTFDSRFPTLTEAIAQAGGITGKANVREIELRRPVAYNRFETQTFDLWELISSGDLQQDVVLQSGDEVFVPTAMALTPEDATAIADASFAPDSINIFVAGEVESPGLQEVPLNTPLNQVILNAGNFNPRARRSTVQLVRLNPDGTVNERQIDIDLAADINDETNPILTDKDVVVVGRSGLATFGDATNIVLSPITRILNTILGFERLLFD
jgi:polysaccharide export outer membrane protein